MSEPKRTADLLYGVPAIAVYLDMRERQARHLCDNGTIPTFRIASTVCAKRSDIDSYLARLAAEAAKAKRAAEAKEADDDKDGPDA